MLAFLMKGGPVMIPLLLCSVLAVAVALERAWYLFRTRASVDELLDEVKLSIQHGKILEAIQSAKRRKGPIAAIVGAGVTNYDKGKEELKERLEEVGREELFKLERRLSWLDTIVTVAPLLGLLGTVTGIIRSFEALGASAGIDQSASLSLGIAEALITTASGLIIAIPSMVVYNWLSSVIDQRVREMNRCSAELLELLQSQRPNWGGS